MYTSNIHTDAPAVDLDALASALAPKLAPKLAPELWALFCAKLAGAAPPSPYIDKCPNGGSDTSWGKLRRKLERAGEIPVVRIGRKCLVRRADWEAYLSRQCSTPAPQAPAPAPTDELDSLRAALGVRRSAP